MHDDRRHLTRSVTFVVAGLQVVGVAVVIDIGAADSVVHDWLQSASIAVAYMWPAALAATALPERRPLLLVAAVSTLILAIFPFSLHSFVLGPAGAAYLVVYTLLTYARGRDEDRNTLRSAAAVVSCAMLAPAAVVAQMLHEDPVCYVQQRSGEVTFEPGPDQATDGSRSLPADSEIVRSGCASDTVVWWEASMSLALSLAAVVTGRALVPLGDPGTAWTAQPGSGSPPGPDH